MLQVKRSARILQGFNPFVLMNTKCWEQEAPFGNWGSRRVLTEHSRPGRCDLHGAAAYRRASQLRDLDKLARGLYAGVVPVKCVFGFGELNIQPQDVAKLCAFILRDF